MIEVTIRNHLLKLLADPVLYERPDELENRYVLIEKTGSSLNNHLYSSTFAFQSHAESMLEVILLNKEVIMAVNKLIELDLIGSVSLNSDYNYTDTSTKQYRYQAVFDIKHY